MELAVNQALAAVVRQVVPVQTAEKIRQLTLQNEHLLEVLDASGVDICNKCYQHCSREDNEICSNCNNNYCPKCVDSIIQCSGDFCGTFCSECMEPRVCEQCERGFCEGCIEHCPRCSCLFCSDDFPQHPCQA